MTLPLSVLDLAPVGAGTSAAEAVRNTVDLARLADRLGYTRYWFAEHHGMPGVASSAPELLIGNAAAATERIRVGSGGIMLPNHAPLRVAEMFHTLEALHPGRIDLGVGRAPGTDPVTIRALHPFDAELFPQQLTELIGLSQGDLPGGHPFRSVRVMPGDVALPPIWILGSSGASARLAGTLGLGYAFASHFSPASPVAAMQAYRESFRPSAQFPEPRAILAVSVVAADTQEHAQFLASSMELGWVRLRRGEFGPIPTPEEALSYPYSPADRAIAENYRRLVFVGTPSSVRSRIEELTHEAGANEVMITTTVHSRTERLRSFELMAEEMGMVAVS